MLQKLCRFDWFDCLKSFVGLNYLITSSDTSKIHYSPFGCVILTFQVIINVLIVVILGLIRQGTDGFEGIKISVLLVKFFIAIVIPAMTYCGMRYQFKSRCNLERKLRKMQVFVSVNDEKLNIYSKKSKVYRLKWFFFTVVFCFWTILNFVYYEIRHFGIQQIFQVYNLVFARIFVNVAIIEPILFLKDIYMCFKSYIDIMNRLKELF